MTTAEEEEIERLRELVSRLERVAKEEHDKLDELVGKGLFSILHDITDTLEIIMQKINGIQKR